MEQPSTSSAGSPYSLSAAWFHAVTRPLRSVAKTAVSRASSSAPCRRARWSPRTRSVTSLWTTIARGVLPANGATRTENQRSAPGAWHGYSHSKSRSPPASTARIAAAT